MITCKECGKEFSKPATRGRPPTRCEACREIIVATKTVAPVKPDVPVWLARCINCSTLWNSTSQCHCPTCHRQFGSITGFDKHRDAEKGICIDPESMRDKRKPVFKQVTRANCTSIVWAMDNEVDWWNKGKDKT
jgi:hypothetical protein